MLIQNARFIIDDIDDLIRRARKRLSRADIFIHTAVIKFLWVPDLIVGYEKFVWRFHFVSLSVCKITKNRRLSGYTRLIIFAQSPLYATIWPYLTSVWFGSGFIYARLNLNQYVKGWAK